MTSRVGVFELKGIGVALNAFWGRIEAIPRSKVDWLRLA